MIDGRCGWCAERIEQQDGPGRPREFCGDAHRVAYARRKATMPPEWDAPTEPVWQPLNQAEWEALRRFHDAHPERYRPSWLDPPCADEEWITALAR